MSSLADLLGRMTVADTLAELWQIHTDAMREFGFDRLLYGLTVNRHGDYVGGLDDVVVLSNHDASYTDGFLTKGQYRDGPMFNWAMRNTGACSWALIADMIAQGPLTETERAVIELNQSHDVVAGYTISFRSHLDRRKSAIALTALRGMDQADVDAIWEQHGNEILLINRVMNLQAQTLPAESMLSRLTERQRQVLEWVGYGKSLQDVAVILDVSQATVEKHLRLARGALSCDTTAQAVMKAALQQQIYVVRA